MDDIAHVFCFCCDLECRAWMPYFEQAGIALTSLAMQDMRDKQRLEEIRNMIDEQSKRSRPVVLFSHITMDIHIEGYFRSLPKAALLVPVGSEAIMLGCSTAEPEHISAINEYLLYSGDENIRSAGQYIRKYLLGDERIFHADPPVIKPFDGIYCADSGTVFDSLEKYLGEKSKTFSNHIGIFFHRNNLMRSDMVVINELVRQLEAAGLGVIAAFSGSDGPSFREIVGTYFTLGSKLKIEALINMQLWAIKAEEGRSVAEQCVFEFKRMGIPVINPIQSHFITAKIWRESPIPISADMSGAYIAPEMAGMTEPVIISVRGEDGKAEALPEMIAHLASRLARLIRLRAKPNSDKKLVIMLHNSVCTGVEATIGAAFGLDTFESVASMLERLELEDYHIGPYPKTGEALRELFMEKKAFSDFRWTAVEDVISNGGCLYKMPVDGQYDMYYRELPEDLRLYMENTWGEPPGEGMVMDGNIIITGLEFGNITIMVQPKRGCYGAKCTGEVCKILHDPACPPPHQYLATYRYIERELDADACIDVGTHGSVENLPGKSNALTEKCWPNIVMGAIPSFYIYNAGVTNESPLVKRRMNSVIIDHLPPPSMGTNENTRQLVRKIEEYFTAIAMDNGQEAEASTEIRALLPGIPAAERLMMRADSFEQGLYEVSGAVKVAEQAQKISLPHIYGNIPGEREIECFIKEVCKGDGLEYDADSPDAISIKEGLMRTGNETDMLLHGLSGGYIPAGEGGMPDENGRNILPTGRNMFGLNTDKVPTKTAYGRGKTLAVQLLESYLKDEGTLPESVAMNMISLNITRTNGEQLSQFLYLLGIEPLWDRLDRVTGLRVMSIEELGRPRIDVTVRISGVLRDTWPTVVELMDEAVLMVAALDEKDDDNYILKNLHAYRAQTGMELESDDRQGAIRIFGDAPGTYGAGIDLALLASAWKDESDLVKYFIHASAFAYGRNLNGRKSIREFIETAKNVDLTCDTDASRRNTSSGSFGTQVQGGYRLIAKHLGKKTIRQYQSTSERGRGVITEALADSLKRSNEETLLNEFWKQSMIERGYDGASIIMNMMQNVFSAQCVTDCFTDDFLDKLTDEYINNDWMREWLASNNHFALEEIARRMLELHTREKWNPDDEILEKLKANYLIIEGDIEESIESTGDIQGGTVEIINDSQIESWCDRLMEIERYIMQS